MSEKEEVLDQLNQIESSLMDSEKFMPYNYNVLILWGLVSALLFLTFDIIASFGILYSISYVGGLIFIVTIIEQYYIKQENIKYDISKFTKTQKFIESTYTFATIISLFLTYLLYVNGLLLYIYLVWIMMIAFVNYVVGFIKNNKYFTSVGIINLSLTFSIFTLSFIFGIDIFSDYLKYIAVVFSSFGCIFIAIKSKKEF